MENASDWKVYRRLFRIQPIQLLIMILCDKRKYQYGHPALQKKERYWKMTRSNSTIKREDYRWKLSVIILNIKTEHSNLETISNNLKQYLKVALNQP